MIILEKPSSAKFVLNTQLCIAAIFAIGILACLILCIAAFALLVYLMTLALQAIGELATQVLLVYHQGDSVVRLVMWFCLAFVLVKLYPIIKRSLHASLKFSVTK
ncbi:MAG: hypothetical protein ACJ8DI_08380 [Ktedonobacteraceae bacterium]